MLLCEREVNAKLMLAQYAISIVGAAALLGTSASAAVTANVFDQGPYDASLESRNSNTASNFGSNQQVADDFVVQGAGWEVEQIDLWYTYLGNANSPTTQDLVVRIFDDLGGNPGSTVFEETFSILPNPTGEGNAFAGNNMIYVVELFLSELFQPEDGVTYWLSPIGADDDVTWQWQFHDDEPAERRSLMGSQGGAEWRDSSESGKFTGNFAFVLHAIPEPSSVALLGLFALGCGLRRSRK